MNVNGNTRLTDQSKFGQVEDKMARGGKTVSQPKVRSAEPMPAQSSTGDAAQAQQNPLMAVVQKLFEAIQGLLTSMLGGGAGGAEAGGAGGEAGGPATGGAAQGAGTGASSGAGGVAGGAGGGAAGAGASAGGGATGAGAGGAATSQTFGSTAGFAFFGFAFAGQQQNAGKGSGGGGSGEQVGGGADAGAAGWSASAVAGGKATIDLGSKYALKLDEKRSEMILVNKETGHETRVWGDPHLDYDNNGQTADDAMFKGTMTFKLPDDTKITINTQPSKDNPGETFADKLTITKGDEAFVVNGLSQNQRGDLTVEHRRGGESLEAATDDGYVMTERPDGKGFISETLGRRPTKRDLEAANA